MDFRGFIIFVRKIHIMRPNISLILPRMTNVGCTTHNLQLQSIPHMPWKIHRGQTTMSADLRVKTSTLKMRDEHFSSSLVLIMRIHPVGATETPQTIVLNLDSL